MAQSRSLDTASDEAAAIALAGAGFQLPAGTRLDDPLTEQTLVRMTQPLQLRPSTSRPEAVVDEQMLARFFEIFGPELGGDNSTNDGRQGHDEGKGWTKGHGKGKGNPRSPHDPN